MTLHLSFKENNDMKESLLWLHSVLFYKDFRLIFDKWYHNNEKSYQLATDTLKQWNFYTILALLLVSECTHCYHLIFFTYLSILIQLLTYGRRIPFAELFARIDAVDASTIKRVANRFIYDKVINNNWNNLTR